MFVGDEKLQADTARYEDMKEPFLMVRPIQIKNDVGAAREQKFRLCHTLRKTQ
jgi:hypothetical protein